MTNAATVVNDACEHQGRMVWKDISRRGAGAQSWKIERTDTLLWDGYNIVRETIDHQPSTTNLSCTLQGAGGVGGLLAEIQNREPYFAAYDANGNVTEYISTNGVTEAQYEYSPFGEIVAQSGDLAASFTHRFSTKPWCGVTGMSEYLFRKYGAGIGRWRSRDPIGERGGWNLYGVCRNDFQNRIDSLGLTPPDLNPFFTGEKATYNVTRALEVSVYCKPAKLSMKRGVSEADDKVNCDGGSIHIIINPHFGVPPGIRPPLDIPGKAIFGGGYGEVPDQFRPIEDWTTPEDFWGDPTHIADTYFGPGSVFSHPIYEFKNAKFNVGRFIDINTAGYGKWSSTELSREEMFRTWSKFDNSVPIEDINAIVPKVSCGDKISIQIGCKGESTLAWKQILEIK